MNENFIEGFEKRAGVKINLSPIAHQVKDPSGGMVGRVRNFLNGQKAKTYTGMALVGAPAILYGGYKGVDKLIGNPDPNPDRHDW